MSDLSGTVVNEVAAGASLSYADVALAPDDPALRARREMEVAFGGSQVARSSDP